MAQMFENAADVKSYALAGLATITLTSQRTGARYTYKISRAKGADWDGSPKKLWFVGLLTGPDNESDYEYVGLINGVFKTTKKTQAAGRRDANPGVSLLLVSRRTRPDATRGRDPALRPMRAVRTQAHRSREHRSRDWSRVCVEDVIRRDPYGY